MAELDPLQWELDGLMLGEGTPYAVLDTSGLEDSAEIDLTSSEAWSDGQIPGMARQADRLVTLTIGFHDSTTEAQKDTLRQAMSLKANRLGQRTLRWRHREGGEGSDPDSLTRRINYRPAAGQSLRVPGDRAHLTYGFSDAVTLRLQVDDPIIYSDAVTTTAVSEATPGSATEIDVTNYGSHAAVTGAPPGSTLGAYQWTITAGGSGCTWPFVKNVTDGIGADTEMWYLAEEIGDSGVISVSWERVTRRNVTQRWATVKGGNGSPIPGWPILRPGVNTLAFGCTVGSITGSFQHRSTW